MSLKEVLTIGLMIGWSLILGGCYSTQPKIPQVLDTVFLSPLSSPSNMVVNPKKGKVYVIDFTNHVSILEQNQLIATLPVGDQERHAMVINEAKDMVYVMNYYSNSVTVIQDIDVLTTVTLAARSPNDMAIDLKNSEVYVVSGRGQTLSPKGSWTVEGNLTVIKDTQNVKTIPLGDVLATFVDIDPINRYLYVGTTKGHIIVLKDLAEITRYNVEATVKSMDVDPRTGDVYALYRAPGNRELSRFSQGKLVATTSVEGPGGAVQTVQVHPITGDLYIVDYSRQEVVVVRDMQVISRITVGWQPEKIAIDPFSSNVYVTNVGDNTVTVIHGTDVLTTIKVGHYPYGLGVNPTNGQVYVSNSQDDSITILGYK